MRCKIAFNSTPGRMISINQRIFVISIIALCFMHIFKTVTSCVTNRMAKFEFRRKHLSSFCESKQRCRLYYEQSVFQVDIGFC